MVITATAIAAVIQLRHVRASNELNAALKLFAFKESAEMQRYFAFVRQVLPTKMEDASFRADFSRVPVDRTVHPEVYVLEYYDMLGQFIQFGLVREDILMATEAVRINAIWNLFEPAIAVMRRKGSDHWIQIEYLTQRARLYLSRRRREAQVPMFERIPVTDRWLAADTADRPSGE